MSHFSFLLYFADESYNGFNTTSFVRFVAGIRGILRGLYCTSPFALSPTKFLDWISIHFHFVINRHLLGL